MKSDFYIQRVNKDVVKDLLYTHHYLKDHSKDFKSGHNYALYRKSFTDILTIGNPLGVCIFTGLPVPEIAVGAFGLQRDQQKGLYELSKLCIHPDLQKEEYNITSWFVSKAIKQLKKILKLGQLSLMLIVSIIMELFTELVILLTVDLLILKKIFIMKMELNIPGDQ
jgi:hypothetical protein